MERLYDADSQGFNPNLREIIHNHNLPYYDELEAESERVLAQIKTNLARTVELRDIKTGAIHWVEQLLRYVRLYGLKFSKEDHIHLVKLLYELLLIPHNEFAISNKFALAINKLLKKQSLLSPEDLTLPWKPLYDFCLTIFDSPYENIGLHFFSDSIVSTVKDTIHNCRTYFPLEATEEMMQLWRPLFCPFDNIVYKPLNCMQHFLPTMISPENHHRGFKIWFDEIMSLWTTLNSSGCEYSLVSLISRLAYDNIGYIDWSPHIPRVFTRFLKGFNLPVGNSKNATQSNNTVDINAYVLWIISMIDKNNSSVQEHIDKLFETLKTFYHPSNTGRWNLKLSNLLVTFPRLFIKRLHRERVAPKSWKTPVPQSHKLTEDDITKFVLSIKPVVFMAMFGKYGMHDASVALKHLACLRPEIILPAFLERMYPAMETLTEPHRLIACMTCIVGVCRPMLQSTKWYPEGRLHVLPLLNLSLPGIDPNDVKKSLVTFQMVSTFVTLVPLVDCSSAIYLRDDLSETEKELCSASSQFEDFVLQFMYKSFSLIENSAQIELHNQSSTSDNSFNPEQSWLEIGLSSTFTAILQQCSTPIFESALSCLFNYVSQTVYETRVGGKFVSDLIKAAVKVNPDKSLKLFIPHFCSNIRRLLAANEDIKEEEKLDVELLWNILMLSQVVRAPGHTLLSFVDDLTDLLSPLLELKCVEAYEYSTSTLRYLLRSLTNIYPLDFRSVPVDIDAPLTEHLIIRDWAYTGSVENADIQWHIPCAEEIQFASRILEKVLKPELEFIKTIDKDNEIPRDDLLRHLTIIFEALLGAGALLPFIDGEAYNIVESEVELLTFSCSASMTEGITFNGSCIRLAVVDAIQPLLNYLLTHCEDDTKNLLKIITIYDCLIFYHGTVKKDFDLRWKNLHSVKEALSMKLGGYKSHVRALLIDRVLLQHELRMLLSVKKKFTSTHRSLLQDLLALSTSRYSEVRKKGQSLLFHMFLNFHYSYNLLLPEIVNNLTDPNAPEHKLKSSLHIIQGNVSKALVVKREWNVLNALWPAVAKAQHSSELSVLRLIDDVNSRVSKSFETPAIKIETSDNCIKAAQELLRVSENSKATPEELETAVLKEAARNKQDTEMYISLTEKLVSLVESGELAWKFHQFTVDLLNLLLRLDHQPPLSAVNLFLKNAVDDSITVREICLLSMVGIFKLMKRKHKSTKINVKELAGCSPSKANDLEFIPCCRDDNNWLTYCERKLPRTKEAWNETVFVEKTHFGFYCWPVEMFTYAPYKEQPNVERVREELDETEKCIYDFWMSKDYIQKFIGFLALEEQKGKDKFKQKHVAFIKGLFRNFGDSFLELLKPEIEKLLAETNLVTRESHHRCALEILAGIIQGMKHWPYEKIMNFWDWSIKLLRKSLNSMIVETVEDWGNFFNLICENRDPRKLYPIYELLMENPINGEGGSLGDASRIYSLQNALMSQEWRVSELLGKLLNYLENFLDHPYKNVRDRIGCVLCYIFLYDYKMTPTCKSFLPLRKSFVEKILAQLDPLKNIYEDSNFLKGEDGMSLPPNGYTSTTKCISSVNQYSGGEESEEKNTLIRICKTILKWFVLTFNSMLNNVTEELFGFLPIFCSLVSQVQEEELQKECLHALANLAQATIAPSVISVAMEKIGEVATLPSWHAKTAVLSFLQALIFNNFFTMHQPEYVQQVQEFIMTLICNERLEVRETASETLSGLLHCGFLKIDDNLLSRFEKLSSTKLKTAGTDGVSLQLLVQRHAGVLGICACIQAYPYEVPQFVPQLLVDISTHVNDIQPIQLTVKKALSNFRRTHHDNWHDHKQKFTDDQLLVLTDLLVSPNYYA
ncbi:proteasome activator complex subunit 4 [Octopus sinensis]|uniref:Proteasome activator complex subunit 4 n=1 Tax=Octopus sinensis TaxID=2607531 RepID=A0A6P7SVT1_9MOLL|nr:proteasome activator complex subunit 4 [Octopus sinensis]